MASVRALFIRIAPGGLVITDERMIVIAKVKLELFRDFRAAPTAVSREIDRRASVVSFRSIFAIATALPVGITEAVEC